jgi:hypothetical protein
MAPFATKHHQSNEYVKKNPSDLRLDAVTAGAGPAGPVH